ncbi:MAG: Gfo/Idh/MocA family oxidoreductase [Planctomycetia bacterium]|nr:Gfo/Idh/MocA family oxidoreductase [Planctomycetia bacterium]
MNLTKEQRETGKENAHAVLGSEFTRRDFLLGSIAAGVASGAGLGSYYFGYGKSVGNPVRVGIIGTGDEGGVLIGALNPNYVDVVAISDIRPYNVHRAFHGDSGSPVARPGLMKKYGYATEDAARKHINVYDQDYMDLLKDSSVEGVIIALPLFIHDKAAIDAMRLGKHVLTEKLMAHSVHQCKEMSRVAHETNVLLATGHQRHYSILYDNAVEIIRQGLLGELHHIRAQWHRGNLPGRDSWSPRLPEEVEAVLKRERDNLAALRAELSDADPSEIDALLTRIELMERQVSDKAVDAAKYGYETKTGYSDADGNPLTITPLHELIRWRLFDRTGGGLMAELGSHQLDAAGIFVSAMREGGQKALPLSVSALGGRTLFPHDRDVDDHVYCMYEFPTPAYVHDDPKTHDKKLVVTYSSINGNPFGEYGEVVLGTKGTIILENEQNMLLFPPNMTDTKVSVAKRNGKVALQTGPSPTSGGGSAAVGKQALDGPVSRGYTEEIEHWAWCIRNRSAENLPRCHPKVALGDAVIALVTNIAIRDRKPIAFDPAWFDIDSDETPEGVKPSVKPA